MPWRDAPVIQAAPPAGAEIGTWRRAPIVTKAADIPSHTDAEGHIAWKFASEDYAATLHNQLYKDPYGKERIKRGTGLDWQRDPIYRDPSTIPSLGPVVEAFRGPRMQTAAERVFLGPDNKFFGIGSDLEQVEKSRLRPEFHDAQGYVADERTSALRYAEAGDELQNLHGSLRIPLEGIRSGINRTGGVVVRAMEDTGGAEEGTADAAVRAVQAQDQIDHRRNPGRLAGAVRGGIASLTQTAMASPLGGVPAVIASHGLSARNEATTEAKDAGLTGTEADDYIRRRTINETVWAAAFSTLGKFVKGAGGAESIGARGAMRELSKLAGRELSKRFAVALTAEQIEELITTAMENQIRKERNVDPRAYFNAEGGIYDHDGNLLPGWSSLIDTSLQTFVTVGAPYTPTTTRRAFDAVTADRSPRAVALKQEGAAAKWAAENPAAAKSLADLAATKDPSRTEVAKATETRRGAWSNPEFRQRFVADVREAVDNAPQAPGAQTLAEADTPTVADPATTPTRPEYEATSPGPSDVNDPVSDRRTVGEESRGTTPDQIATAPQAAATSAAPVVNASPVADAEHSAHHQSDATRPGEPPTPRPPAGDSLIRRWNADAAPGEQFQKPEPFRSFQDGGGKIRQMNDDELARYETLADDYAQRLIDAHDFAEHAVARGRNADASPTETDMDELRSLLEQAHAAARTAVARESRGIKPPDADGLLKLAEVRRTSLRKQVEAAKHVEQDSNATDDQRKAAQVRGAEALAELRRLNAGLGSNKLRVDPRRPPPHLQPSTADASESPSIGTPPPSTAAEPSAPTNRPFPKTFDPRRPRKKLHEGGEKIIWSYETPDGQAFAVALPKPDKDPRIIDQELKVLDELKKLGVKVVPHEGIMIGDQHGIVMHVYPLGSKKVVRLAEETRQVEKIGTSHLLNEKSIADLNTLLRIMEKQRIRIHDLQFLIAEDGSLFLNDPKRVVPHREGPSHNNKRMIELLIESARENIERP
jgi:hypothetical protein